MGSPKLNIQSRLMSTINSLRVALVAALSFLFATVTAPAQSPARPVSPPAVNYVQEKDGALILLANHIEPGIVLDAYYQRLFWTTNVNNPEAWKILTAAMSSRGESAQQLAEQDPACGGLNQFDHSDCVARLLPWYQAELKKAGEFSKVKILAVFDPHDDGAPQPFYDTVKGGFLCSISHPGMTLFAEGKPWNLSLLTLPESQARQLMANDHPPYDSFCVMAVISGNLIPPQAAAEHHLSADGLMIDVRQVELHLVKFQEKFQTSGPSVMMQDSVLESPRFTFASSLAPAAQSAAETAGSEKERPLAEYLRVNEQEISWNGTPHPAALQYYPESATERNRFYLRLICYYTVSELPKQIEDLKAKIARLQTAMAREEAINGKTNSAEIQRLASYQANLADLTAPLMTRAQARAQVLDTIHRHGEGNPDLADFLCDLSDPKDASTIPASLENFRKSLARFAAHPNLKPEEAAWVVDLGHRIGNVLDLIKAGNQAEAQKQLDALWYWALLDPLPRK